VFKGERKQKNEIASSLKKKKKYLALYDFGGFGRTDEKLCKKKYFDP